MATHRIQIFGGASLPKTGDIFLEPYSVKATNAISDRLVLIFKDGAAKFTLGLGFIVPKNYAGSPKIVFTFQPNALTSGTKVIFGFEYNAIASGEAGDPSTFTETVTANPTASGVTLQDASVSIALTAGNFAIDDRVAGNLFRDPSNVNDDHAADVIVMPETIVFEYSDV